MFFKLWKSKGRTQQICKVSLKNNINRPSQFIETSQKRQATDDDDVFHFVSYIHFKNAIYEIDGLQDGPILVKSDVEKKDWIDQLKPFIIDRISLYSENEIKFNLMYVTDCKINKLTNMLYSIEDKIAYVNHKLSGSAYNGTGYKDIDSMSQDQINEEIGRLYGEKETFELSLAEETKRREDNKLENTRRQHNYIPLIFEMLKYLGEKNVLETCYQKAKEEEEKEEANKNKNKSN